MISRRPLLLLLVVAGCASPDPAYYTLRPVPGTPVPGAPGAVKLARPGLAGYLDRPEIVRDSATNRLSLRSGERWGEPLGDMIGRVMGEDLTQRLPGSTVFTEAGSISVDADTTVEMDIVRFDLDTSGVVVLLAQVAVRAGRSRTGAVTRSIRLTLPPASAATPDLVAAMSGLIGQLADTVAGMLRGLPAPPRA
jgi:uncharacterized lipoprotein YmbA